MSKFEVKVQVNEQGDCHFAATCETELKKAAIEAFRTKIVTIVCTMIAASLVVIPPLISFYSGNTQVGEQVRNSQPH